MNKLTLSTILIFVGINICVGQDLGISSVILYQKTNNTWNPTYKSEYLKESLVETTYRYRWEHNKWLKEREEIRTYSPNGDTVTLERTDWENDTVASTFKKFCYYARDQKNTIVDLYVDGKSIMATRAHVNQEILFDISIPCPPTNYPFDKVFREAEILNRADIPLEGKIFVVDWCVYFEFVASCDEFNRINSFESETRKVVVAYRENGNLVPDFEKLFKVYPNPFHEDLVIDLFDIYMKKIEIRNSFGVKVYEVLLDGENKVNLNLPEIPVGLYWINLYKGENVYTQKLIKI